MLVGMQIKVFVGVELSWDLQLAVGVMIAAHVVGEAMLVSR